MDENSLIYQASPNERCFYQCEILSDFTQYISEIPIGNQQPKIDQRFHEYVLILTQDCDLIQDFNSRFSEVRNNEFQNSSQFLPSILFLELDTADLLKKKRDIKSDLWKPLKNNKNERFQFLRNIDPGDDRLNIGVPSLVGDFKRIFSVPTSIVYTMRIENLLKRRVIIRSPYKEDIITRFTYYISRIALPEPHYQPDSG